MKSPITSQHFDWIMFVTRKFANGQERQVYHTSFLTSQIARDSIFQQICHTNNKGNVQFPIKDCWEEDY